MSEGRQPPSLREAARCGAGTRRGTPCRVPVIRGRRRCRRHGGTHGSGAPAGNRNAYKHGRHSVAARAERKALQTLLRQLKAELEEF